MLRACTCEVISYLYRNEFNVAQGGGGEASVGGLGGEPHPRGSRGGAAFGGFLCRSAGRQRAPFLSISDEVVLLQPESVAPRRICVVMNYLGSG